jgi:hypothetical protein
MNTLFTLDRGTSSVKVGNDFSLDGGTESVEVSNDCTTDCSRLMEEQNRSRSVRII